MPRSRNFEEQTGCFALIPGEVIAGFDYSLAGGSPVIINLAGGFLLGFLLSFLPLFIWVRGEDERGRRQGKRKLNGQPGNKGA